MDKPCINDDSHRFDNKKNSTQALAKALKTNLQDFPSTFTKYNLEIDVFILFSRNRTSNVGEPIYHVTVVQENHCDIQQ